MKQFYTLCIAVVLLSIGGNAQATGVTTYNATTIYSQEFRKIIRTSDGGFLAISSSAINGRICKMNSAYTMLWAFEMDSLPFVDMIETNDGNYVFQGYSYRADYPSGPVHIIKLTPAGTVLFERMYYDPNNNAAIVATGIAKAAGADNGFVFYGGDCLAMQYMAKCDANGIIQWENSYSSGFGAGSITAVITESAGYTCALAAASSQSVGILKLDASGNPLAARTMQSANGVSIYANCLVKLNSGDYFLWARPNDIQGSQNYTISNSFANITCNRVSNTSVEITGAFATGNANDEVMLTFVAYNTYYGGFLKVTPAGTIAVQKYSSNTSNLARCLGGLSLNNGTYLLNGNVNSNRAMLAAVDETGAGFCSSQNSGCAVQQNFSFTNATPTVTPFAINIASAAISYTLNPITYTSVSLCGNLTGINENNSEASAISVYPNPFINKISIDRPVNGEVAINIFDAMGRMVMTKKERGTKIEIAMDDFINGIYSVQLIDETGTKVFRVIKNE